MFNSLSARQRWIHVLTIAVFAGCSSLAVGQTAGFEPDPARVPLYTLAAEMHPPATQGNLGGLRITRVASLDVNPAAVAAVLPGDARRFVLPMFDDRRFSADFHHVTPLPSGGLAASGRIVGVPHGRVWLVVRGGTLAGAIQAPGIGSFEIRTGADGRFVLRELRIEADGASYCAALTPPAHGIADRPLQQAPRQVENLPHRQMETVPHRALEIPPHRELENLPHSVRGEVDCPLRRSPLAGYPCDDGSMVDVMVVYTAAARDAAGGVAQIEALIDLATAIANDALADSLTGVQVRIVHKALIDYTETGDFNIDLPRLTDPDDGHLDSVHADRDVYGADLVHLWVSSLNTGGAAYQLFALGPDDDGRYGFGILRQDFAATDLFAHELGHNFGCQHDRPNAPNDGHFSYSYGFREPGGVWRTTMAYPPGDTIVAFSNPDLDYTGPLGNPGPTGVPGEDPDTSCDNARTIRETTWTLANFRPSTLAEAPPSRLYVRPAAPAGGDGASWATAHQDVQEALCRAVQSRGAVTEIWVAAGTYKPDRGTNDRKVSFRLAEGVALYGGFAGNETQLSQRNPSTHLAILSGDIGIPGDDSDNTFHVVDGSDLGPSAALDGFVIESGAADGAWPHSVGGGMRIVCGAPTIRNCTFRANRAADGGAVFCDRGSQPLLLDCTFEENTAATSGGAVYSFESSPTFDGCTFRDNEALYGGASEHYRGQPAYDDCTFEQNNAEWGGAVSNYQSAPAFSSCAFLGNSAVYGGGAMINGDGSLVTIEDCTLAGNEADFGGAVYNYGGSDAAILSTLFAGNITVGDGGAIYNYDASPTVRLCTFEDNTAAFGSGGAIESVAGGAMRVEDSAFTGNTATYNGGAVADYDAGSGYLRCTFHDNNADYGGAALVGGGSSTQFVNCGFFGNVATWAGGAIENNDSTPVFAGCVFSGNLADNSHGGAMSSGNNGAPLLINCTLAGNVAGWRGGGIASDPPHTAVWNSILWDNADAFGAAETSQVHHWNTSVLTDFSDSTVQGWTGAFGGPRNDGLNPLFVDPAGPDTLVGTPDDDLRPGTGSPMIDAGNNLLVPADALDADADGDTAEPLPLDYAGNPRFADDPATADTGVGAPPLVDRGAYEFAPAACPEDLDGDGQVGLSDLSTLLSNYGTFGGATHEMGDINGDGNVDLADLSALLSAFGATCE